jgi:hypothetical protein
MYDVARVEAVGDPAVVQHHQTPIRQDVEGSTEDY